MSAPTRELPEHHATKAGGADRPVFVCAECLELWPCRHVARCLVCGRGWSEHPDSEYRLGCQAPRS